MSIITTQNIKTQPLELILTAAQGDISNFADLRLINILFVLHCTISLPHPSARFEITPVVLGVGVRRCFCRHGCARLSLFWATNVISLLAI